MSNKPVKIVRRSYSDEYRRNAVSLIENQGYTTAQAARELGVNANLLRKWRQKYGKLASADSKASLCISSSRSWSWINFAGRTTVFVSSVTC